MARSAWREPTSFWREKSDSRVHSTTRFSENVMEAEISYQMLEVLSFCDRERAQTPSIKITVLTCNKTFQAYYFLRRGKKTSESSMLTNLKVSILELLPAKEIPA